VVVCLMGRGRVFDAERIGRQQFSAAKRSTSYVPFLGEFGGAWVDTMVARWRANPLGMLWPEMDAAVVSFSRCRRPLAMARRPVIIIAAGRCSARAEWAASVRALIASSRITRAGAGSGIVQLALERDHVLRPEPGRAVPGQRPRQITARGWTSSISRAMRVPSSA
jgi:hypothetical protein